MKSDKKPHISYKEFCERVLDNTFDAIYLVGTDGKISFWNKAAEEATGYSREFVKSKQCCKDFLIHIDEEGNRLCNTSACPIVQTLESKKPLETDTFLLHKNGQRIPVHLRTIPLHDDDGALLGALEIFRDVSLKTTIRQRMTELVQLAMLDPTTGVGTRKYTEINLAGLLDEMKRYNWEFGVLFVDIDHFKRVNDAYGHDTGDIVLKMVAQTMAHNIRSFDIIGRWGGEEFLVILVNTTVAQLKTIAEKLRILVQHSTLNIGDARISVTISIGATMARKDDTIESIVKRADRLMYRSKGKGRNTITMDGEE
jgi:diguanylate cyclase (GGDEF)-like protein/PAS domain S-box-containing protein